jgi:hypothetical protein
MPKKNLDQIIESPLDSDLEHDIDNSIDKLNKNIQIGASSKPRRKSSVDSVKVWKKIREKVPGFFREICTCENMGYCTCDEI